MLIRFPDDCYVAKTFNIQYQQATLKPSEPILAPKYHWEMPRTNMYGSVFKSSRGYEMYYQCGNALRVAYAFSNDGIQWQRPMTSPTDFSAPTSDIVKSHLTHTDNSSGESLSKGQLSEDLLAEMPLDKGLEMTNLVAGYHMPSVIYDPSKTKAYKMFAFGEGGYCTLESSNGKQFDANPDNPVIALLSYKNELTEKTWCSDVAPCFKDKSGYTAMVKTYLVDNEGRTRRCIGKSTSDDFKTWNQVETVWAPGDAEDAIARSRGYQWADFYGLCPFPYGEGYLGFLWLFEIEKELPRGTNLGKIEVFLAYSADGNQWRRLDDKPLIPWDLNFGAEGGMVTTPSAPIFDQNDIKLYYSDCNYEHGFAEKDFTKQVLEPTWVIRCAQLPKDRLVGAYSQKGVIEFKSIDFKGDKIRLNIACKNGFVQLDYQVSGKTVATQKIENLDQTDHFIASPVEGSATLIVTLNNAALYALEV